MMMMMMVIMMMMMMMMMIYHVYSMPLLHVGSFRLPGVKGRSEEYQIRDIRRPPPHPRRALGVVVMKGSRVIVARVQN